MKFEIDKKQLRLFKILLTIPYGIFFIYAISKLRPGLISGLAMTYCAFLNQLLREEDTEICVDEDKLHYSRLGVYEDLNWNDIQKIKFSGLTWFPPFHSMVIYTRINKLKIDFMLKDYKKAWNYILANYSKYSDAPLIDTKLISILKKH